MCGHEHLYRYGSLHIRIWFGQRPNISCHCYDSDTPHHGGDYSQEYFPAACGIRCHETVMVYLGIIVVTVSHSVYHFYDITGSNPYFNGRKRYCLCFLYYKRRSEIYPEAQIGGKRYPGHGKGNDQEYHRFFRGNCR